MKREAFKALGNPLLMGGPVLFSRVGDSGDVPVGPIHEGPFDGTDWRDLPVGGSTVTLVHYQLWSDDRPTYSFSFEQPRGDPNGNGEYTFNMLEDGVSVNTFAFLPSQFPGASGVFQSNNPTASNLLFTTNNGDTTEFDVQFPAGMEQGVFYPPGTLDDQVQAILAGREGCVFDLKDNATRFQDNAGTIPVTADGQAVAHVKSKWGTLAYAYNTATTTRWPAAASRGLVFDGVDDNLPGVGNILSFMRNVAKITTGIRFTPADVTLSGTPWYFSRVGSGAQNWMDFLQSTTGLRYVTRRVQTDGTTIFTATEVLEDDEPVTALMEADFDVTGRMECRLNGAQLAGANILGTLGLTEDGNSSGATLGAASNTVSRFKGEIRKLFLARFALTPAERTTVEAWLEAP